MEKKWVAIEDEAIIQDVETEEILNAAENVYILYLDEPKNPEHDDEISGDVEEMISFDEVVMMILKLHTYSKCNIPDVDRRLSNDILQQFGAIVRRHKISVIATKHK